MSTPLSLTAGSFPAPPDACQAGIIGMASAVGSASVRLVIAWAINAAALWAANALFSGVRIHGWWAYIIGAAVLGIANAVIKPVLALLTLPLIILTLGLFLLVINIAMIGLAEWIAPNFSIDGFWTYVGTVVIIWLVNWLGHSLVDELEGSRRRPSLT
jgi:putative membrane protein